MTHKSNLFFILFLFFPLFCTSQVLLSEVQFDKIEPLKVQKYIQHQMENQIPSFEEIEPSLNPESGVSGYRMQKRKYILKDNIEKIWQHYLTTKPQDAWDCHKINFGLLFSGKDQRLFYSEDHVDSLNTDQVIFLNLKLLGGLKNLTLAFEITTIDPIKKLIEFSYIKGNTSEGKQQLKFEETKNGFTRITHKSYFKSHSWFRDHLLYPYFHTRVTNTFHRNMKRGLKTSD